MKFENSQTQQTALFRRIFVTRGDPEVTDRRFGETKEHIYSITYASRMLPVELTWSYGDQLASGKIITEIGAQKTPVKYNDLLLQPIIVRQAVSWNHEDEPNGIFDGSQIEEIVIALAEDGESLQEVRKSTKEFANQLAGRYKAEFVDLSNLRANDPSFRRYFTTGD